MNHFSKPRKWQRIEMSLASREDIDTLEKMDYTKLSAINMCPTWGVLRYGMHKAMPGGGRSMALEAGKALHDCFATIRLLQLGYEQGAMEHMHYHGERLFGEPRWACITAMLAHTTSFSSDSVRNAVLETLTTAGYVDDPSDRRRTFSNLETAILYYLSRWDAKRYPVWMRDYADPTADIGVEVPFAIKIQPFIDTWALTPFIYTGRIDGLHNISLGSDELLIQENKSASRLDDSWRQSFDMSHQVTGYCVAGSLFTNTHITRGLVLGLSLPLPKYMTDGLAIVDVRRPQFMSERWLQWLEYTTNVYNANKDDPYNAPRHTHSCNRYFRPCSMIPFCASDLVDQQDMVEQMVTDEWSPLTEKTGE